MGAEEDLKAINALLDELFPDDWSLPYPKEAQYRMPDDSDRAEHGL
jgi:hypothetical protein